ncbi:hypothetical protein ZIOFF_064819 [Zingiber officinale]|uniref:Uncharacterized protein n=1 Tax=Zingiber officinale TaxID=94328 RepID=A0A8J5KAT0_ZINOF|nr:hypothetical protein ZIOFF_064819 [Zingiber officinale]
MCLPQEARAFERRLAIDETNLFETLGGIQPFIDLSTNFYNRVFADEEEWGSDLSFRIRRRRTRFGTSHPALIGQHAPFPVTHQAAERWHTTYFLMGGNEMTRQRQQVLNVSMQQMDHQHLPEIQLARQLTQHLHSCVYVKDAGKDVAVGFQISGSSAYGVCTIKKSE